MLNIETGIQPRPQKVVLYGVEGIGKTTLAAQAPEPLFIDTEGGTSHMDVRRVRPQSWTELLAMVDEVAATPGVCKTLVIDTADWAEAMAIDHICTKYRQPGLESFGYGKGYTYLAEEFSRLLAGCDKVIASGKHVVITAHARQRKVELPDETGSFDVWGLKLSKQCAPLLKEWPDALLFANYKTYVVVTDDKKHKAQGGKRVIYTAHRATIDAKNRHGLPEEIDLCWDAIAPIFSQTAGNGPASPVQPADDRMKPCSPETLEALRERLRLDGIGEEELQALVAMKGHFPKETPLEGYPERFIQNWIFKHWDNIRTTIQSNPEHTPF